MRMMDDWIHIRLVENKTAQLALPDGYEKNVNDEDTLFEVLELGPQVKKVKPGDVCVVSFMSGMFRFKLPGVAHKSFAIRESEIIGVVPKQVEVANAGIRLSNKET